MSDYMGSLEEHVDNDVSGQGITGAICLTCGAWMAHENAACDCDGFEDDFDEEDELERRWSGEFRVIPDPVVEPEMPDWMKAESDRLFYGPKFSSSYYGR